MPELPEVETIRRGLAKRILAKTIKGISVAKLRLIKNSLAEFKKELIGNRFQAIDRVGKLLIFRLTKGHKYMLIHLKMTGQLIYKDKNELIAGGHNLPLIEDLPNKYSHIIFNFVGGAHLYFNDMRQFGYAQLVNKNSLEKIVAKYGLEPTSSSFSWLNFKKIFVNKKTKLKAFLLNQQQIAGIGNIYADEICWQVKILPWRPIAKIKEAELKRLYQACRRILAQAVSQGGTTFSAYRRADGKKGGYQTYLQVYGRQGQKCHRCRRLILKNKVAGRGTHYCLFCQK